MSKIKTLLVFLTISLGNSSELAAANKYIPVELTPEQTEEVQKNIRKRLKDPGSAQFGVMKAAVTPANRVLFCGLINAKNSFGGYIGERPFLYEVNLNGTADFLIAKDESSIIRLYKTCERSEIPLR